MTLPFARWLAHAHVSHLRSFHFGKVFRKGLAGGQPRELFGCEFNIVSNPASPSLALVLVAETMRGLAEVLEEFQPEIGPSYIRFNSHRILQALLRDIAGEPDQIVSKIFSSLSSAWRKPWVRVREEIRMHPGVQSSTVILLEELADMQGANSATTLLVRHIPHVHSNLN